MSILAAAVLLVIAVLTIGLADLTTVLVASDKAQTAADAAALAASQELALPTGLTPYDAAATLARLNGATLTQCLCAQGQVEASVTVSLSVGSLLLLPGDHVVHADARAVVTAPSPGSLPQSSP